MKFSITKSLFLLGVACSGLGYIFSVYAEQGHGFILGDSNELEKISESSPSDFRDEQASRPDERSYREELNRRGIYKRQYREKQATQEIVIPKAIRIPIVRSEEKIPKVSGESQDEKRGVIKTAVLEKSDGGEKKDTNEDNERKSENEKSVAHAPIAINTPGEVTISTEIDIEENEGVQEAGFYSKGSSGQENYLGKGTEVSRGRFEYTNDLSKQLSNGEQELIFKSKKEKIGNSGEKIVSEETKSIPVMMDIRSDEFEVEVREEKKRGLIEDLRKSGVDPARISEIASIPADQIAFVKEIEFKDSDQDGITNLEEKNRGTDPFLADSDNDGFLDGDEVRNGYDPKKFSPGDGRDKVAFENPKDIAEKERKNPETKTVDVRYEVGSVEIVRASSSTEKDKVRFSGTALPNTFVTLYVYSDPIIVTLKTDADGNWSYDLDKNVEDGDHEAYIAVTDNTGKITSRSEGIGFVKTASAITVKPIASAAESAVSNQSPLERSQMEYFFVAFIAILFFSGAALIVVSRRSSVDH